MIGIARYSAYVPRFRLERRLIAEAWGGKQPAGEIAVANYDEDALTMAVEAASECLGDAAGSVGGLYFASTSSPYWEKQVASFVATACDLRREIFTADFGGSARAGLSAMLAAIRAVQAGATERVVVTAADSRLADPESELEGVLGDAAAAVTIADDDVIAEVVDSASVAEEFTYVWRTDRSRSVQISGGRFANQYGYERDLKPAIGAILQRQKLQPEDIAHVALYSPDMRAAADLVKSLGFDPKRQLSERLAARIGCTGTAEALLQLAHVLDTAKPNELILVGSFGEGADVILFRTTERINDHRAVTSVARWIDAKAPLPSYAKYLKYRRLVDVEEVVEVVTNVLESKELKQDIRLYGSRCRACGQVQYPVAQVCIKCRAQEQMEDARLARRGTVFTYTVDHLIANVEHPLPMAVIDMDGGGRLYLQVADSDTVDVGDSVVLTFRRLHEGGGNHNYYWKARPIR
jgi:3-hydroxy-3-methylglutaryl CoA synthase